MTVQQVRQAQTITKIDSVQNLYNIDERQHDEVIDHCEAHGIAFLAWKPLRYGSPGEPAGPVATVARDLGATPVQVALAWLLARSPSMIPIPGTASIQHLDENWRAATIRLDSRHQDILRRTA